MIHLLRAPESALPDVRVEVLRLLKRAGEAVRPGEAVLEVALEKAAFEVAAPAAPDPAGPLMLQEVFAAEGQALPGGSILALLAPAGAPGLAEARAAAAAENRRRLADALAAQAATAAARETAALEPAGFAGVRLAPAPLPLDPAAAREPLSPLRRAIAERLSWSQRELPQFHVRVRAEMTAIQAFRQELRAHQRRVGISDLLLKAAALAARKFPGVCRHLDGDRAVACPSVDVGFAVALEDGLIEPVIRGADRLALDELSRCAQSLTERARRRSLMPEEYSGAVLSVSNLGMLGVDEFAAIVPPGESLIVSVGRTIETPVAVRGEVVIRPLMSLTVNADHRLVDGALAAQFAGELKRLLENPRLLDESTDGASGLGRPTL